MVRRIWSRCEVCALICEWWFLVCASHSSHNKCNLNHRKTLFVWDFIQVNHLSILTFANKYRKPFSFLPSRYFIKRYPDIRKPPSSITFTTAYTLYIVNCTLYMYCSILWQRKWEQKWKDNRTKHLIISRKFKMWTEQLIRMFDFNPKFRF